MKIGSKKISKKQLIIILVCAAVVFAAAAVAVHFATRLTDESYENCSLGDVNGDGYINSVDSLLIIESTTDEGLLFDSQKKLADVNSDGKVDSFDSLILLRYTVGEIREIPYDDSQEEGKETNKSIDVEKNGLKFSAEIQNEWDNGDGTRSYHIGCRLKNSNASADINWQTALEFNKKAKVTKEWDCRCSSKSGIVSISGDCVYALSEIEFEFIVTAKEGLSIESADIIK